jgi:hypothetical protein
MGLMDNMKDKMSDGGTDKLRQRYNMLKDKSDRGELTDDMRQEYEQLRPRFENHGGQ